MITNIDRLECVESKLKRVLNTLWDNPAKAKAEIADVYYLLESYFNHIDKNGKEIPTET